MNMSNLDRRKLVAIGAADRTPSALERIAA